MSGGRPGKWEIEPGVHSFEGLFLALVFVDGEGRRSEPQAIAIDDVPAMMETFVQRGDTDAAKDIGRVWLHLRGQKYGVRGLEWEPAP